MTRTTASQTTAPVPPFPTPVPPFPAPTPARAARRRDVLLAGALGAAALALYLLTLCPTVFWYDSAEYATAAVTLGIPHPPGYPLYTLLGRLFVFLPVEPAYAVNLMSAVFGALVVAQAYLILRALELEPVAAATAAGALAASRLFWSQCIIAESYVPGLAFLLLVLLLLLRGLRRDQGKTMALAAALAGLGLGAHLFVATAGLGFAALVLGLGLRLERFDDLRLLLGRQVLARRLRTAAAALGAALLGSCIFLWVPLRAAMGPLLNFEDPSSWRRFAWFVTGGNYKSWWLRGDYNRLERAGLIAGVFYDQLLVVGAVLAALGLLHLLRRRPLPGLALALIAAGNIGFFFNYNVHDVEVFFLPTVVTLFLLVGAGAHALLAALDRVVAGGRRGIATLARVVLCAFPLSLVAANYGAVDLRGYTAARDYGEAMCRELAPGAVILNFTTPPEWKNDAVFAHYFQKVLRRRPDVRVVSRLSATGAARLIQRGVPIYLYYPNPRALELFELRKVGPAYRLLRPRLPPAPERKL